MKPLSIDYIAEGTEGKLLSRAEGGKYDFADNVAIDSRMPLKTDCFSHNRGPDRCSCISKRRGFTRMPYGSSFR